MGDPKQVVAHGYDMVAEAYADWGQGAKHPTKQRFMSMARRLLPNGGVAIDLGCGTGEHVTAELAEHFDTTGVDISAHSIDLAAAGAVCSIPGRRYDGRGLSLCNG